MDVFAQAASGSEIWTIAAAAVATAGAAIASLFTYLSARDKLRFDSELAFLRKSIVDCTTECKAHREKYEQADGRADAAEKRCAILEGQMKGMEWELNALHAEVKELKDQLRAR